jgi:hypothetical protein
MRDHCENRLTVIGLRSEVGRFQASQWEKTLRAEYVDLVECPPGRYVCQFMTASHQLKRLQQLSRRWPGLVFLLDYEVRRMKGLAKARSGGLEHCEISF